MANEEETSEDNTPDEVEVNDDFSFTSPKDGQTYSLQPKQKKFCIAYMKHDGNGVEAVIEAGYDVYKDENKEYPNRKAAAAIAYENLGKPHIQAYINSLLEEYGFTDDNVERQHLFLINQHEDKKTKAKAIDMYYKLTGEYAKKEVDVTSDGEQIKGNTIRLVDFDDDESESEG